MFNVAQKSLPSVFTHSFSRVPEAHKPRSTFTRILTNKTTIDVDYLYPIISDEILPVHLITTYLVVVPASLAAGCALAGASEALAPELAAEPDPETGVSDLAG